MIIKKTTSVQKTSTSLWSTIPKFASEILDIDKGDIVIWEIDTKEETVTLKRGLKLE